MSKLADEYDFITVKEFAEMLRLSKMQVSRMLSNGEIRHYRIGDSIRIRRQDAAEYIERSEVNPPPAD